MRKLLVPILALFLSASAFASGDVEVVSFTADKTSVTTGEDFTFVARLRNNGPDAAANVNVNFLNTHGEAMFVLAATPAAGWQCSTAFLNCWTDSMPAGADVNLTYHATAPADIDAAPFALRVLVSADINPGNNHADLPLTLTASAIKANLSITASGRPNPIPRNTLMTLSYDVRNNGPQALNDVRVVVHIPVVNLPKTFNGDGWTCTPDDQLTTTCKRDQLAASTSSTVSVRFTTLDSSTRVDTRAHVFSAQAHHDEDVSNNSAYRTLAFGDAGDWSRILVPFPASETPGANGSLWKAEISGVIESDTLPVLDANGCGPLEDPCAPPPLNRLFDAADEYLVFPSDGPQFVYVGESDADKVTLATRVYDASKSSTTAGAFIPMARDEDFETAGFSLIAIPVAAQYRSMLRIYDATGADNRDVELTLYGDSENTPFLRSQIRLRLVDGHATATTADLPLYPASAQVDLTTLIPSGYTAVRAAIRPTPIDGAPGAPAMQLWGFVSITNNETSHVTIVAP
ncbi:MAG TPA: hypothetical protein VGQ76_02700 [Thermoanaerobaculia bacterium]|jgi:hypothetical protein|nr:hypothetical protein [Thermoanaerobaculia bacterium]